MISFAIAPVLSFSTPAFHPSNQTKVRTRTAPTTISTYLMAGALLMANEASLFAKAVMVFSGGDATLTASAVAYRYEPHRKLRQSHRDCLGRLEPRRTKCN